MAELVQLINELETAVTRPIGRSHDDLKHALTEQARTLDRLFHFLGKQSLGENARSTQLDLLKMSLRAQSQYTATVRALDAMETTAVRSEQSLEALSDEELLAIVSGEGA
jgi:uncharacterized membrane protein YgaE (UPF0421/DUF939 family)